MYLSVSQTTTRQVSVIETPLHLAVKGGNLAEVVNLLKGGADVNEADEHGNTALLLAVKYGHREMFRPLMLQKVDVCNRNEDNEDVFKMAVNNKDIGVTEALVDSMISIGHTGGGSNDSVTLCVKQALCHAASLGLCNKIEVLSKLNRSMEFRDENGNTMFHHAARTNQYEVIVRFGHILDINVQNAPDGDTPLHVACKNIGYESILALLDEKVNLGLVNESGDTALHCFAREETSGKSEVIQKVMDKYFARWERWWMVTNNKQVKSLTNDEYLKLRNQALQKLIRQNENNSNRSVLASAFESGSFNVIESILNLDNVSRFTQTVKNHVQYDVTELTPRTFSSKTSSKSSKSYLELLLENNSQQVVAEILDIATVKRVEVMYSSMTTLVYLMIILFHALYMSLFSYSSVVLMDRIRQDPGSEKIDFVTVIFYGVVPIEPLFFLLGLVYRFHCSRTTWSNMSFLSPGTFLLQCFSIIYRVIYICLVIALLYQYNIREMYNMHNTLSVTLLIGWLTTLSFTQGLKPIRSFWRMILHMIAVDVYKVLFVYAFVLLSFSFALHVQFQVSKQVVQTYPTPFHTMFLVFRLMIGMSELFDGDFERNIEKAGGSLALPIILFITYIVISTIVLMNLLIAMMNESYSDILTNLKLSRRIETIQRAINLEKTVPWLTKIISKRVIKCGRINFQYGRLEQAPADPNGLLWYVETKESVGSGSPNEDDQSNAAMEQMLNDKMGVLEHNVMGRMDQLHNRLDDIYRQLKLMKH